LYKAWVVQGGIVIRDRIAEERRELAEVLEGLTPEQWSSPSLCEGWTVGHVVAHVTMPFRYSAPRFVLEFVRARGRFDRAADTVARRDVSLPRAELIATLRDNAEHPWKPPGGGYEGALTHDVVHGLDVTRPLGIDRQIPPERLAVVLESLTGTRSLRHFGVGVEGVGLRAVDVDWSHGDGAPLVGRGDDLVLMLAGRPVAPGALTGGGADLIAGRAR
jgi:uncharacterized protein (TIGR03083 family)